MQTDILLKQLYSSLGELKATIEKSEKHPSPSTHYTEQLHSAIYHSNKLVSAYLVHKEQHDLSPDLNLHMKLMNVPTGEEKAAIVEPIKEQVVVLTAVAEVVKPIEELIAPVAEKLIEPIDEIKPQVKEFPKITININDKFRFINELFEANATEYNIAIEQINAVSTLVELNNYLNGLKSIYEWKDDSEVVKNIYALAQKRFA